MQVLEDNEERGHNKYLQHHTDEHTANGCRTQRLVSVLAHTASKHHGQKTDNHSQTCHQDGSQTRCCTQDGTVLDGHTCASAFQSELNDKDSVLCQESDKHNEGNLHVNVVLMTEELRKDERTRQAKRQRKNYRQGEQITLVLSRENEVDEHQTEGENNSRGVGLFVFRTRQT